MVGLSGIQMAFEYQTVWHPTSYDHSYTGLVQYSDPHCNVEILQVRFCDNQALEFFVTFDNKFLKQYSNTTLFFQSYETFINFFIQLGVKGYSILWL